MSKEIVVWCTRHLEKLDERVPGIEREITIDGKTVTIDVCDKCRDEFLAPFLDLIEEFGEPVSGRGPKKKKAKSTTNSESASSGPKYTPNANGMFECTYPGCHEEYKTPQGLGRHRTSHDDA